MTVIEPLVACVFPPVQRQRYTCYNTHSGPPLDCGAYNLLRPEKLWQMYAPCPFWFLLYAGVYWFVPNVMERVNLTTTFDWLARASLATIGQPGKGKPRHYILDTSLPGFDTEQPLFREGVWPTQVQAAIDL